MPKTKPSVAGRRPQESAMPFRIRWWEVVIALALGTAFFFLFMYVTVSVSGMDLPKTAILSRRNVSWNAKIAAVEKSMDRQAQRLDLLEVRDDKIYRSVYGMDEIPQAVRLSGLRGANRYDGLEGTSLLELVKRMDILEKRVYIQSKSFDDVMALQATAGDMALHIPAISPMSTEKGTYHLSSPFGGRSDPINGIRKRHTGMDFACPSGNPIYATGDGVVVKVARERKGYGNHVVIDHGFGYKTRYAHLSRIDVSAGDVPTFTMRLCIGKITSIPPCTWTLACLRKIIMPL